MKTLKQVFPNYFEGAIFEVLGRLKDLPWKGKYSDILVDTDYISSYGTRIISPLVNDLLNENEELTEQAKEKLANIIYARFGVNWQKLFDTMSLQYNPIENYSMVETEQATGQANGTNEQETKQESELANGRYGFNSGTSNPTETSKASGNNKTKGTNSLNNSTDRTLTRSGNIGVTTSQQMITSERDVWLYDYFKVIFSQVNLLLTIPYYEGCNYE